MSTINTSALDGAKAAIAIATGAATSEPIVLRAHEFADVDSAVKAALFATEVPGIEYLTIDVPASYGVHGVHAEIGDDTFNGTGNYLTAVIRIASDHPISDLTLIPVLSSIRREIEGAAEEVDIFICRHVYIIDEPAPATLT
ncbi:MULTISPECIES: hypothetical protein [unclassified Microbacterium]|uniref:hypothetical protein n=1 Tax=unclassified Microbacterium TaxID=2609290 RepID=UPI0028832E1C|nr:MULTISPECIES: hypothetical protein [unclassified Microbacterium]